MTDISVLNNKIVRNRTFIDMDVYSTFIFSWNYYDGEKSDMIADTDQNSLY